MEGVGKSDAGEYFEVIDIEIVKGGRDEVSVGGVGEVGEEGAGCGRLLFDFHLQLLINTIFQI